MALPVIEKLAAHGPVKAVRGIAEVVNPHGGTVFAEAVGEYAIVGRGRAEVHGGSASGLDLADGLDLDGLARGVVDRDLKIGKRGAGVGAEPVDEIGLAGQAGEGHLPLFGRSKIPVRGAVRDR